MESPTVVMRKTNTGMHSSVPLTSLYLYKLQNYQSGVLFYKYLAWVPEGCFNLSLAKTLKCDM